MSRSIPDHASKDFLKVLIERSQCGDQDAFEELVRLYQGRVWGVVIRIVRRPEIADEIGNEAFLKAWMKISTLRDPSKFEGWLLRGVATNLALDHLRSTQAEREATTENLDVGDSRGCEHDSPRAHDLNPVEAATRKEGTEALTLCIATLPNRQRAVFISACCWELPHSQVAEEEGITAGAVSKTVHDAKRNLRKCLMRRGMGPEDVR